MLQGDSCYNELAFMNAIISIGKLHFQRAQLTQGKIVTAEETWERQGNP